MIETIYIEEEILDHPRVQNICDRFPKATTITCDRYTNVFNNNSQNFRLQKKNPALILAKKYNKQVLPTPAGYGIGSDRNYYFSHMLNCLYDCRYCFLQGMYRSAHYLVFVNYEDFFDQIKRTAFESPEDTWFFSGYDCDSLAMEPVTGFMNEALNYFSTLSNAQLEIRTKSTQIRSLLNREPIPNCVVAFSFSPEKTANALEHGVPSIQKRIGALQKLQEKGWKTGLRLDPIVFSQTIQHDYADLLDQIFSKIKADQVHSVSYGMFRLPKPFFRKMVRLYPEEKLFSMPLTEHNTQVSFSEEAEKTSLSIVHSLLLKYVEEQVIFPCK